MAFTYLAVLLINFQFNLMLIQYDNTEPYLHLGWISSCVSSYIYLCHVNYNYSMNYGPFIYEKAL